MDEDVKEVMDDARNSMGKALESFQRELSRVRTGRANLSILDGVRVDYYGTPTPLNQVAALTVADPRLITVKPWEKNMLSAVEKAIMVAGTGLTPNNDGELIRLAIPPLTGERRKELVKKVSASLENARVQVRNCRRDANDMIKMLDSLPEDAGIRGKKSVQDLTDDYIKRLEAVCAEKENEILEV